MYAIRVVHLLYYPLFHVPQALTTIRVNHSDVHSRLTGAQNRQIGKL